ncbi:ABC transporter permease [Paenibacillus thermotolerans]|uniref:ABC transporter permease n=1 Tax=Paenibacillus thermotolerans TaxID=3027807 RepID=UPI002368E999|nr:MULTISPECIES: ABC transporter permease [unclassified Paenibacillus]
MNDLEQLWLRRRQEERKETLPHWKYVFGSGFGLVSAGVIFGGFHAYVTALRYVERAGSIEVSLALIAAALLLPVLLWNPVRTYIIEPDIVFLSPAESRMDAYFRAPKRAGAVRSGLLTVAVLAAVWPFYSALGGSTASYLLVAAGVLLMKAILFYGAWAEKQFESNRIRVLFVIVKAVAAFAAVSVLFRHPPSAALPAAAAVWGAYVLALRAPRRFAVHWERLIRAERRTVAAWEAWFNQFVDLPRREETYRRRPVIEAMLAGVPWGKAGAYTYLYWRTLLRSSIYSIAARLIALAYLFFFLFPGLWTGPLIYFLFLFLVGVQLRSVRRIRRDLLHLAVSPIPENDRQRAARAVVRKAQLLCALLLAVPLFWAAAGTAGIGAALSLIIAGAGKGGGQP